MANQLDWVLYYDDVQAHVRYLEVQARKGSLPTCATEERCEDCPLGGQCPVSADNDFIALLLYYSSLHTVTENLRDRRLHAVVRVLRRHKLPMHWELVAQIVDKEEPQLFPSDKSVLGILTRNPDRFSEDSPGSYFLEPPPT